MKRKILFVLLAVFLLTFVVSGAQLAFVFFEYNKADEYYTEMQEKYVEIETAPLPNIDEMGEEPPPTEETASVPITVKFDQLLEKHQDVVGWLYCEDTIINYPVVQGKDNNQYLHTDLNGKYLRSGSLFVDYRCGSIGTQRNYVIYGHSMRNKSMFGTLSDYKKQSHYDAHPVFYYSTPDGDYRIELFAGVVVDSSDKIYQMHLDDASFEKHLQKLQKKSTFRSEVEWQPGDRVITLSTCSYEHDSARYVVIGKLVPLQ